eukprot:6471786-Amphidinium_carterae.1
MQKDNGSTHCYRSNHISSTTTPLRPPSTAEVTTRRCTDSYFSQRRVSTDLSCEYGNTWHGYDHKEQPEVGDTRLQCNDRGSVRLHYIGHHFYIKAAMIDQYYKNVDYTLDEEHTRQEAAKPKRLQQPCKPSPQEVVERKITHSPYRDWCEICAEFQKQKTIPLKKGPTARPADSRLSKDSWWRMDYRLRCYSPRASGCEPSIIELVNKATKQMPHLGTVERYYQRLFAQLRTTKFQFCRDYNRGQQEHQLT